MPAALVAVALLVVFATAPQAMAQATVQYYAAPSGAHPHDVAPATARGPTGSSSAPTARRG